MCGLTIFHIASLNTVPYLLQRSGNLKLACAQFCLGWHSCVLGISLDCPIIMLFGQCAFLEFMTVCIRITGSWVFCLANAVIVLIEIYFVTHSVFIGSSPEDIMLQVQSAWYPLIFLILFYVSYLSIKMKQDNSFVMRMIGTLHAIIYKLEEAMQGQNNFISSMSHEMRNPLNSTLGSIYIL